MLLLGVLIVSDLVLTQALAHGKIIARMLTYSPTHLLAQPSIFVYAEKYNCEGGQIDTSGSNEIRSTKSNSKDSCAADCDATTACVGFDFTTKTQDYSTCRMVKNSDNPRSDPGDENRQFCTRAGASAKHYVDQALLLCKKACTTHALTLILAITHALTLFVALTRALTLVLAITHARYTV